MECPTCGKQIAQTQQYCIHCGAKIEVSFKEVQDSFKAEAARERGRGVENMLRWTTFALLVVAAAVFTWNNLYKQPLIFDGGILPVLPDPPSVDPKAAKGEPKK
jgi:uncharacterized membrane protein YvbJ